MQYREWYLYLKTCLRETLTVQDKCNLTVTSRIWLKSPLSFPIPVVLLIVSWRVSRRLKSGDTHLFEVNLRILQYTNIWFTVCVWSLVYEMQCVWPLSCFFPFSYLRFWIHIHLRERRYKRQSSWFLPPMIYCKIVSYSLLIIILSVVK